MALVLPGRDVGNYRPGPNDDRRWYNQLAYDAAANRENTRQAVADFKREKEAYTADMASRKRPRPSGNLRGTTRFAAKKPVRFRRGAGPRFQTTNEFEVSKYRKRYRPLSFRRRRRYKRFKTRGYDKAYIPVPPAIVNLGTPTTTSNMPHFDLLESVDPLDVLAMFVNSTGAQQTPTNTYVHLNFRRVGFKFEFVNSNSFNIFIRLIFGKNPDALGNSDFTTLLASMPPQINNPMTVRQYTTSWNRIEGKRFITLGPGARTQVDVGTSFGLRRCDYTSSDSRLLLFCVHIQAWPELCVPAQAFATETSEGLAYPKMNAFSYIKKPYFNISYPEQFYLKPFEIRSSITGLPAVLSTVEVKAENVMTSATT